MDRNHWIVSDPPHGEVNLRRASALLGLGTPETRLKVNFGAPEVWLAYSDGDESAAAVNDLRAAGLSVVAVPADKLVTVPPPTPVLTFSLTDEEFVARTADDEVHVPFDGPVIGSFSKPPADFAVGDSASRPRRGARTAMGQLSSRAFLEGLVGLGHSESQQEAVETLERTPNLDLYFPGDGGARRVSLALGLVDFAGLGEEKRPRSGDNMDVLVALCERRFTDLTLDKRLVNVRPRRRSTVGGPADVDGAERKLYSFGSVGLQHLLESLSPDLAQITHFELGSRLSYLMRSVDHPLWATPAQETGAG